MAAHDDEVERPSPLDLIPPHAKWSPELEASLTQAMETGGRWACLALQATNGDCQAALHTLIARLLADRNAVALAAFLAAHGLLNGVLFAAEKERSAHH